MILLSGRLPLEELFHLILYLNSRQLDRETPMKRLKEYISMMMMSQDFWETRGRMVRGTAESYGSVQTDSKHSQDAE